MNIYGSLMRIDNRNPWNKALRTTTEKSRTGLDQEKNNNLGLYQDKKWKFWTNLDQSGGPWLPGPKDLLNEASWTIKRVYLESLFFRRMIHIFLMNDLDITFVLMQTDQSYFQQCRNQIQMTFVDPTQKFLFLNQNPILFELWIALIPQTYQDHSGLRSNSGGAIT